MKKSIVIALISVLIVAVSVGMYIATSAQNTDTPAEEPQTLKVSDEEAPAYTGTDIYVLSAEKAVANREGYIFGVKAAAVFYPETVKGENASPDRYFTKIRLQPGENPADYIETVRACEGVSDAWVYSYKSAAVNGENGYCLGGLVYITVNSAPEAFGTADANGNYEFYGVKCKAIEYSDSYQNGVDAKMHLLTLHLAEGVDEISALDILNASETVTSAFVHEYRPATDILE